MTADEARKMTEAAKNPEEVLEKVISKITEAAKNGKSYVIISEEQLSLTRAALTELGYTFQAHDYDQDKVVW